MQRRDSRRQFLQREVRAVELDEAHDVTADAALDVDDAILGAVTASERPGCSSSAACSVRAKSRKCLVVVNAGSVSVR